MQDEILDVDLLAFERGDSSARSAVVDGVMRSLRTGFVFTEHDLSTDLLDTAYGMLEQFFTLDPDAKQRYTAPGTNGQRGYTGLLVETAAIADVPDWKEMLNWGREIPEGHPLRTRYPHRFADNVFPDEHVPGIGAVLRQFYDRVFDLQARFLRIIAVGLGCHENFFDNMLTDGATLTRSIHYPAMDLAPGAEHVWAGEHGDINLITALPRATARGLQVKLDDGTWIDALPPDDRVIMNTGIMLDHLTNGVIAPGVHRVVADPDQPGDRYSVVQFCHPSPWTILSPIPTTVTDEHPLRYSPIAAADRLDQVLYEINLIEDGRRVDS
ncbi:MAG: isopenicillin N synthase family dioxygenase [Acidimicrobiales bacterium]